MHLSKEARDAKLRALYRIISRKLRQPAADLLIVAGGVIVVADAIAKDWLGWGIVAVVAVLGFAMMAVGYFIRIGRDEISDYTSD